MKKIFVLSVSLLVCMLIGFACKKSSTTTTTTPPASTTSVPTNTTTTNFTVDGISAGNPISYTNSVSNYAVTGLDGNHRYPQIQLVFSTATSPATGTYAIVNTNGAYPTAGHCELILVTTSGSYPASSGNVNVVAGASSSAYFTNITCANSGTTHTVTGNVSWQ